MPPRRRRRSHRRTSRRSGSLSYLLIAVLVVGIALILAVCWLACRFKDDDLETPLITLRRGKSKQKGSKKKFEEPEKEKDDAKAS